MRTIALLGDSITASCRHRRGDWFGVANLLAGRRFQRAGNFGVGGDTTADMLTRIDDVLDRADWTLVEGGGNDIARPSASDPEAVIENLAAMYGKIEAGGRRVLASTVLASVNMTGDRTAAWHEVNEWIRSTGLPLCDWSDVFGQPSTIRRRLAPDGVHPNELGAVALGVRLSRTLRRI